MPEYVYATRFRVRWIPRWVPWGRAVTIWWPLLALARIYIPAGYRDLPHGKLERTKAHEVVHVRQWYTLGRWGFVKTWLSREGRLFEIEAPAFAASCRWWFDAGYDHLMREGVLTPVVDHYALELRDRYGTGATLAECREAIEKEVLT